MDQPMSNWFSSIPAALDTIAFAAKFQQEMMAHQLRYYKSRYTQYRGYIEKLKRELNEAKKLNQTLSNENHSLKRTLGDPRNAYEPADFVNANGKRPILPPNQFYRSGHNSSSPRSIPTPVAPQRLTLPPVQQPPELVSSKHANQVARPVSNRQAIQQYAYVPPETPQFKVPRLSRAQAAPQQFKRTQPSGNNSDPGPSEVSHWAQGNSTNIAVQQRQHNYQQPLQYTASMQRGPQFKPAVNEGRGAGPSHQRNIGTMGPPPTPRPGFGASANGLSTASERFVPPTPASAMKAGEVPGQQQQQQRRFFPPPSVNQLAKPSGGAGTVSRSQQQCPSNSTGSRDVSLNVNSAGTGGQRVPFLPGGNKPATSSRSTSQFQ
ncbi:hypothetical protein CC2G_005461 [Coprinopsis cinerea AmutBmut pab1-1]|nr:hypothetical protein CC2G_005461 [Coprinopsis cinerea AmutBmut pab1-1]